MTCLLDRLLAPGALTALFQPVFDLRGAGARVLYYEGLLRTAEPCQLSRPEMLFSYARRKRAQAALDVAAIATVLECARALPARAAVGLNIHATTLAQDFDFPMRLCETAERCGFAPSQLVLEVVEHGLPRDLRALDEPLSALRDVGVRIAVDDVGTGEANLELLLACAPSLIKLDGTFVRGVGPDHRRRAIVAAMAGLALALGAGLIAEGVEVSEDLLALRELGVDRVQGFLLGRPAPAASFGEAPWSALAG